METPVLFVVLTLLAASSIIVALVLDRVVGGEKEPRGGARTGWLLLPPTCTPGPHRGRDVNRIRRIAQTLPFPYAGTFFLTAHATAYARSLHPALGRTINGGVLHSPDLRAALDPSRPLGSEAQEWIALEGGLALVDPTVDGTLVFQWSDLDFIHPLRETFLGDVQIGLAIKRPGGEAIPLVVQANPDGMAALYAIARLAGVDGA